MIHLIIHDDNDEEEDLSAFEALANLSQAIDRSRKATNIEDDCNPDELTNDFRSEVGEPTAKTMKSEKGKGKREGWFKPGLLRQ